MHSILIIDLARSFGGAEIRVMETARAVAEELVCGVAVLDGSPIHLKLEKEGVVVHPLPFRRGDPRLAFKIADLIKKHGYNVIDTHNPQSNLWGGIGAKLSGMSKFITTVHSSVDETVSRYKTVLYNKVLQFSYKMGADFIAVSESVNQYLLGLGIPQERVNLIPNGLKISENNQARSGKQLWQSLGWSVDCFAIIIVGRIEAIKGHRYFIAALPQILEKHPNVRCFIAGTGREETRLKGLVKEYGLGNIVYFAGFCDNIRDILPGFDLFCMPSLSEGLPYALLEACAAKVPVISSAVGGVVELLADGHSAVLVPPKDPAELTKGVMTIIEHPEKTAELVDNAFNIVKDDYSISKSISGTCALYDQMIRGVVADRNSI